MESESGQSFRLGSAVVDAGADPFDVRDDRRPVYEVSRWSPGVADTSGSAGDDEVAGYESDERRYVLDQRYRIENEILGVRSLHGLSVDCAGDRI